MGQKLKKKNSSSSSEQDGAQLAWNVNSSCSDLHMLEVYFYVLMWIGAVGFAAYSTFKITQVHSSELNKYDFEEGWTIIGRKKDISDFEWTFWSRWFLKDIFPWYIGHILLARVINRFFITSRSGALTLYGMFAVGILVGMKPLLLTVIQCAVIYSTGVLVKSVSSVWIIGLAMLSTLNIKSTAEWMKSSFDAEESNNVYYLAVFTLAMTNIRYISFCVDMVQHHQLSGQVTSQHFSFMDLLTYIFYFPLYFTGPIITYDQFSAQFYKEQKVWIKTELLDVAQQMCRVFFWAVISEVILHFVYFSSLQYHEHLMTSMPLWALAGVGYWHGQFFMLKYVVMFGIPRVCAKMDRIQVAGGPKCICTITLYSQMWKSFDQGLYSFLKRYIYIPCGGSKCGMLRQLFASLLSFAFIYVWHGAEYYLFIWVALNFVGVSLEIIVSKLMVSSIPLKLKKQYISDAMYLRLVAMVVTPLFGMSCIAIFIFFGGTKTGGLFYKRLIIEGFPVSTFTTFFFLYCGVQTSMAVSVWENRKKVVKS